MDIKHNAFYLLSGLFLMCAATSCEEWEKPFTPQTYDVQGKVEKGPFISGSEITIQPMDADLQVTGSMFNTAITDDLGNFVLGSKLFETPYAEFMANGYFFNEVKGELSNGTLTLRALVDLSDNATVNVNVLTHLKYARIKKLVTSGKSFDEANAQAQEELLNAFGLSRFNDKEVSSFSIIAGTEESAALIAISSLLLMERTEAALTEYLSKLSTEFSQDGRFSDEIQAQMLSDQNKIAADLPEIRHHIIERYNELGIEVEIKDLSYYFDWDKDGLAGNELLRENEKVLLSDSLIEVPNEGGRYSIQIESPVPLYLEPQVEMPLIPNFGTTTDEFLSGDLYDGYDLESLKDKEISVETSLEENTLIINLAQLASKIQKSKSIPLYDYIGNVVASVEIVQEGRPIDVSVADAPLLGTSAQEIVNAAARSLTEALTNYNVVEQYYHYNLLVENELTRYVNPNSSNIYDAWANLYQTLSAVLLLKKMDAAFLNVYADYCHVWMALCYSNLVYGWDGVPYIPEYDLLEQIVRGIPRVSPQYIFEDLKEKLQDAIGNLPERKNESLRDINALFFASKDVARVLLANIYMFENNYVEAKPLLEKVIENGFYTLDASTDFKPSTTTNVVDVSESTEVIFALRRDAGTRAAVMISEPGVIPYITLSDVYLSLAECYYCLEDSTTAETYLQYVMTAKNLSVSESSVLMKIKSLREQILLHSTTYFAFLKRVGLAKDVCGIKEYLLLFPIPRAELENNRLMVQNPGWN